MQITKTYTKTFNLKDINEAKALAREYATNGNMVETEIMVEQQDGRHRFMGMQLMVDGVVQGQVFSTKLSEVEYLEAFVLLVERTKMNPQGTNTTTGAATEGFKRGKLSEAEKMEIRSLSDMGMSVEDIMVSTSRSQAAVEKVIAASTVTELVTQGFLS